MEITKELDLQRQYQIGNIDYVVNNSRMAKLIPDANDEELRQSFRYIFGLIGLKGENIPDEGEKMIILDYCRSNFQRFTISDIVTAFTFYVKKIIDYQDPPYQHFSILFLENVMQSYRRLQVTVPRVEPMKAIEEKTSLTDDQKELLAYQNTMRAFEVYKNTMHLHDFGNAIYEYLKGWGCMKQSQEGRDRRIERAKKDLIKEAKDSINDLNKSTILKVIAGITNDNDQVISRAKTIRVMDFFDVLIEKGVELKDVLK